MTNTPLVAPTKLGDLIDMRADAYAQVKRLNDQLAAAKKLVDDIDVEIMARFDEDGMTQARGSKASMSVKEADVPVVKDWDTLYNYIRESGYFHLLNRAPNAAAFRELFERGDPIPGVESFTKRSLTFKSI